VTSFLELAPILSPATSGDIRRAFININFEETWKNGEADRSRVREIVAGGAPSPLSSSVMCIKKYFISVCAARGTRRRD